MSSLRAIAFDFASDILVERFGEDWLIRHDEWVRDEIDVFLMDRPKN